MKISEILNCATEILQSNGIAEPRREAQSLLAFALNKNHTFLVAHSEDELSETEKNHFQSILERRARREPFQYIIGRQEFCGLDFLVTPDVLIPRPETELIVENAVEILREKRQARFCEIGTGSGCIAVSILREAKTARAIASDISEKALKVAKKNAETHGVAERLELKLSDVFKNLGEEKFDLIVSNPPYIAANEIKNLQTEVRDFEPRAALTDDEDGFSIIEKIIGGAPGFLKKNGCLLMEIGFGQAGEVLRMFAPHVRETVEFALDLQRIPRMIKARLI